MRDEVDPTPEDPTPEDPTPEERETVTVLSYVEALKAYRERTLATLPQAIDAFGPCGCKHRGHIGPCKHITYGGPRRIRETCGCKWYWHDDGSTGGTL